MKAIILDKNSCPKPFNTFSSFSNRQNGGKIVFGIDKNVDYEICGIYDAADLQKKIMEQSLQMEPAIRPLCTIASFDRKSIVCTEIQEIDTFPKPCFYKGQDALKVLMCGSATATELYPNMRFTALKHLRKNSG